MSSEATYDVNLLSHAPPDTASPEGRSRKNNKFYDASLLKPEEGKDDPLGSQSKELSQASPDVSNVKESLIPESEGHAYSKHARPWYRSPAGIIAIIVVFILVIGAVIGGAVGGSMANKSKPQNASASGSKLPPTIIVSSSAGNAGQDSGSTTTQAAGVGQASPATSHTTTAGAAPTAQVAGTGGS